jgi:hypothetical protein
MFIKDEGKRMVAYLKLAKEICKGSCSNCAAKEERIDYNPVSVDLLKRQYWMKRIADVLPSDICTVGLTLGERLQNYGLKNPSQHSGEIISIARTLKKNSVEDVNPEKIKSNMSFLIAHLNLSEENPQPEAVVEFENHPKENTIL